MARCAARGWRRRRRRPGTSSRRAGCRSAANTSGTGVTATSYCSTRATWWASNRSPNATTTATLSTNLPCAIAKSWPWTSRDLTPSQFAASSGPQSSSGISPSTLRKNGNFCHTLPCITKILYIVTTLHLSVLCAIHPYIQSVQYKVNNLLIPYIWHVINDLAMQYIVYHWE